MKFVTLLAGMMLVSQTEQAIIFASDNPSNLRGQPLKLGNFIKTTGASTAGMASNVISKASTVATKIPSQILTATNILTASDSNSSSGSGDVRVNLNNPNQGLVVQTSSGSSGSSNQSSGSSSSGSASSSMSSSASSGSSSSSGASSTSSVTGSASDTKASSGSSSGQSSMSGQ